MFGQQETRGWRGVLVTPHAVCVSRVPSAHIREVQGGTSRDKQRASSCIGEGGRCFSLLDVQC